MWTQQEAREDAVPAGHSSHPAVIFGLQPNLLTLGQVDRQAAGRHLEPHERSCKEPVTTASSALTEVMLTLRERESQKETSRAPSSFISTHRRLSKVAWYTKWYVPATRHLQHKVK